MRPEPSVRCLWYSDHCLCRRAQQAFVTQVSILASLGFLFALSVIEARAPFKPCGWKCLLSPLFTLPILLAVAVFADASPKPTIIALTGLIPPQIPKSEANGMPSACVSVWPPFFLAEFLRLKSIQQAETLSPCYKQSTLSPCSPVTFLTQTPCLGKDLFI